MFEMYCVRVKKKTISVLPMPDTIIAKTKLDSDSVSKHRLESGALFTS